MTDPNYPHEPPGTEIDGFRLSRGTLLRGAAVGMVGMSPLLAAACGGSGSSGSTGGGSTGGGKPVPGGTLRAGFVGGGTAETLNPYAGVTPIDESRVQNLYNPLLVENPDLSTSPGLALEMNANADATEYEVKLRAGVEFHNGKTFGAEDLIYSSVACLRAVVTRDRPQTRQSALPVSGPVRRQGRGQIIGGPEPCSATPRDPSTRVGQVRTISWTARSGSTVTGPSRSAGTWSCSTSSIWMKVADTPGKVTVRRPSKDSAGSSCNVIRLSITDSTLATAIRVSAARGNR